MTRSRGIRVRVCRLVGLAWAAAALSAAVPAASGTTHAGCKAAGPAVPHAAHAAGQAEAPEGASAWAPADGCPHCAGNLDCPDGVRCVPTAPAALVATPPTLATLSANRLREGWRADRPLSENPTPPTPPPAPVL